MKTRTASAIIWSSAYDPVDEETLWGTWIHHPVPGIKLKEAMDKLGMECHLEYRDLEETFQQHSKIILFILTEAAS